MITNLGFWIRVQCSSLGRSSSIPGAFEAYSRSADRMDPCGEAYLSAFTYGEEFQDHVNRTGGSVKGYRGICDAPFSGGISTTKKTWNWLSAMPGSSWRRSWTASARLGMTTWSPSTPAQGLPRRAAGVLRSGAVADIPLDRTLVGRAFATEARIRVDAGIYDSVRPFRCPNSRHPKTGLFKRRLDYTDLMGLSLDGTAPLPRNLRLLNFRSRNRRPKTSPWFGDSRPRPSAPQRPSSSRQATSATSDRLNRATLDFIREGASVGDRPPLCSSPRRLNLAVVGAGYDLA